MFGRRRRSPGNRATPVPEQRDQWGLLMPVATASSRQSATQLSGLLAEHTIRCTLVPATATAATATAGTRGCWDVVVFPEDAPAAYQVLSTLLPDLTDAERPARMAAIEPEWEHWALTYPQAFRGAEDTRIAV